MYTFGREKKKISITSFLIFGVGTLFFMMGALIYIWPNIKILDLNYSYYHSEQEKKRLMTRNRLLKIEIESLKSLEQIERAARSQGFIMPLNEQIVYLAAEK